MKDPPWVVGKRNVLVNNGAFSGSFVPRKTSSGGVSPLWGNGAGTTAPWGGEGNGQVFRSEQEWKKVQGWESPCPKRKHQNALCVTP